MLECHSKLTHILYRLETSNGDSFPSRSAWKIMRSRTLTQFAVVLWAQCGALPDHSTHVEAFTEAALRTLVRGEKITETFNEIIQDF